MEKEKIIRSRENVCTGLIDHIIIRKDKYFECQL